MEKCLNSSKNEMGEISNKKLKYVKFEIVSIIFKDLFDFYCNLRDKILEKSSYTFFVIAITSNNIFVTLLYVGDDLIIFFNQTILYHSSSLHREFPNERAVKEFSC